MKSLENPVLIAGTHCDLLKDSSTRIAQLEQENYVVYSNYENLFHAHIELLKDLSIAWQSVHLAEYRATFSHALYTDIKSHLDAGV